MLALLLLAMSSYAQDGARTLRLPSQQSGLDHLPLVFEPNNGQAIRSTRFLAHRGGQEIEFRDQEVAISSKGASRLRIRPIAPSGLATIEGLSPTGGVSNYFIGTQDQWHLGIPNFGRVAFKELYPGIDWVFRGSREDIEYDFVLAPGADPSKIILEFEDVDRVRIDRSTSCWGPTGSDSD
jgi:hypothetical protein